MLYKQFAAAVLAILLIGSAAHAVTISAHWPDGWGYFRDVSYDDDGAGPHSAYVDNIPIGMFIWEPTSGSNNPSPFNKQFVTFCIDADQYVQTPSTFTIKPLEQAPVSNGPGAVGSGAGTFMTSTQVDLIRELWGEQYPNLLKGTFTEKNDKTAAFQLAIWEILFEQSPTKNPANGYLKVINYSGTPNYITIANQYLAQTYDAGYSAYETRLIALTSANGQDHITMVPTPMASLGGFALISALSLFRRR